MVGISSNNSSGWHSITAENLSLGLSIGSGQPLAFHSDYSSDLGIERLTYSTSKGIIFLRKKASRLSFSYSGDYNDAEAMKEIISRFGLEDDFGEICNRIDTDQFMHEALSKMNGLRVTLNDPWETTLCFLISQFNNIKRIRGITQKMVTKFGREAIIDGTSYKLFPMPEEIANATLAEIRSCGTGFRDKYIKSVAEECSNGMSLASLKDMGYSEAKEELMALDGIGDKVADCILLFGYKRFEAFPIDSWVKRIIENVYFKGRKKSINEIHAHAASKWGDLAGYAQQYLYWHGRENKIGKK